MAQTPCVYRQLGDTVDYTPGSAVAAGTVYVFGTTVVTIVPKAIAADEKGATATRGVFSVPKDNSDVAAGDALYWDDDGNPVGGDSGSGAFTKTAGGNIFAGYALEAAGTSVRAVEMFLRSIDGTIPGALGPVPVATVVVGGTAIANANAIPGTGFTLVTGADNTAAVRLPEAAAGKICIVKNAEAGSILKVFPAVNDTINGAAANAVYNQGNAALRTYVAYNAVAWFAAPEGENL
jgi:predicted RecA/RadA family phage recombinase